MNPLARNPLAALLSRRELAVVALERHRWYECRAGMAARARERLVALTEETGAVLDWRESGEW